MAKVPSPEVSAADPKDPSEPSGEHDHEKDLEPFQYQLGRFLQKRGHEKLLLSWFLLALAFPPSTSVVDDRSDYQNDYQSDQNTEDVLHTDDSDDNADDGQSDEKG